MAKRTEPLVAAVSLTLKSSASTASSSDEAPAAVFQAARLISQLACPLDGAAQVLQALPSEAQMLPVARASPTARPLPAPKR